MGHYASEMFYNVNDTTPDPPVALIDGDYEYHSSAKKSWYHAPCGSVVGNRDLHRKYCPANVIEEDPV